MLICMKLIPLTLDEVQNPFDINKSIWKELLINYSLGNPEPTNDNIQSGDLNNDNTLNILDIVLLVNLILS